MIRIFVDREVIVRNKETGSRDPVFIVQYPSDGSSSYVHGLEILGPSKLVYRPESVSSPSVAWIETDALVYAFEDDSE